MKMRVLFSIEPLLHQWGIAEGYIAPINLAFGILIILLGAFLSDIIARRLILTLLARFVERSENTWDDIIFEHKVFNRLSHLAPAFILHWSVGYVFKDYPKWETLFQGAIQIYFIVLILMVLTSFLKALNEIYMTQPISKDRPIKGYIQIVQILFYSIAFILILSVILGKSPIVLLTGIGALAAVLILVFKDTILGFVASIQLSANNMVRIGDWISLPKHNTDGTVIEITLNTVKVQNWDKTISTIPTYVLVSDSFGNWRGMEESGGRRIKRHLLLDMRSVKFCTPELLEKLKQVIYLKDYIQSALQEIEHYNRINQIDPEIVVNGRRLTNIGVFRKYVQLYLQHHPKINQELTLLVRQLQPTETGIPIEIYAFSSDKQWANYEGLQADIFDHILAVLPEFELRVFQNPTGEDFKAIR